MVFGDLLLQGDVLSADCCQWDMSVADCRFWKPMGGNVRKLRTEFLAKRQKILSEGYEQTRICIWMI